MDGGHVRNNPVRVEHNFTQNKIKLISSTRKVLAELLTWKSTEHKPTHPHPRGWPKHPHFLWQSTSPWGQTWYRCSWKDGHWWTAQVSALGSWETRQTAIKLWEEDYGTKTATGDTEEENRRQQNKYQTVIQTNFPGLKKKNKIRLSSDLSDIKTLCQKKMG